MHGESHTTPGLSRRGLLRICIGMSALGGVAALVAACSPSTPNATVAPTTVSANAVGKALTLPAYQPPANIPAPDFPGSADGVVMPGYVNWPKTSFQSVRQAPGDGSEISIFLDLPGGP